MIEWFDSDEETSASPPPAFDPGKEMDLLNLLMKISLLYLSMLQMEHHPTSLFVESDNSPVASDDASVADSYNPDEPDPENMQPNLAISKELTSSPIPLEPSTS